MATFRTAAKIGLVAIGIAAGACSNNSGGSGPIPADVKSIMFLQRIARTDTGNVFDYTSYQPGARLVTLTPPSADGKLQVLTDGIPGQDFSSADIMSYDLSFDAKSVVFSAKMNANDHYNLYSMNLDGTNFLQLTEGDANYVYPIFVPGQKIFFESSKSVEADAAQFQDEYERQTTAQVGTINLDGSNETLGPRNVSHRVSPALLPNGRVLYTEWRHMGMTNDGHLRMMNEDMTGMREAFGGEKGGEGFTNSYLKARVVQTTTQGSVSNTQLIAIGTSRDRTLQSGKLLLIDLNDSEADSHATDLTPLVPGDRTPSKLGVGRFYDAEVIGNPNDQTFLTSWADGPVESEILAMANSNANFGIYVYNGKTHVRSPIFDDAAYWDVLARPIKARPEPAPTSSPISGTSTTLAALNVYDSSLQTIPAGSIVKVRLIEGFSGEEGIRTFGSTEFDGQSLYGEVAINPTDSSFAAKVPGNVPFHMQVIDKFAMSIVNESIWISGRAGEQRVCGGCHEDRTKQTPITSGVQEALLRGAVNLDVPRPQRVSTNYAYGSIKGVPWDLAIQPALTAKCASCHDGDASKPGNPSYTIVDRTTMTSQTFTFDLRGDKLPVTVGEKMSGDFTASYVSLMGLGEMLGEDVVEIMEAHPGDYQPNGYVSAGSAKDSAVIQMLNPMQRFPGVDNNVRAIPAGKAPKVATTCAASPGTTCVHPTEMGGTGFDAEEMYRLILSIDMGGQFFSRENKSSANNP